MAASKPIPRYTGPGFPFGAAVAGVLGPKSDVEVIITSIINILTTPKGSIPWNPKAGSLVSFLLFEILDTITLNLIRYYTTKDLVEQEPRITVRSVYAQRVGENQVSVQVGFSIIGDPEERVFSTPVSFGQHDPAGGV